MLFSKGQLHLLEALHDNAASHAAQSNGFFEVYGFDPKKLEPYHTLHHRGDTTNRRSVGNRLDPDQLETTAVAIDARYAPLTRDRHEQSERLAIALDNMGELVLRGNNIGLAQKHGETRDIAFGLGFSSIELDRRNARHRTGLILSKAIDYLYIDPGSFGHPKELVDGFLKGIHLEANDDGLVQVRDFLGLVADYSYLTLPSTQTFAELRELHEGKFKRYNDSVLQLISDDLKATETDGAPPMVLSFSATGTLEKQLDVEKYQEGVAIPGNYSTIPETVDVDGQNDIRVIGDMNPRIVSFLQHCISYAGGIVLEASDRSQIDINPRIRYIDNPEKLVLLGDALVDTLNVLHPGVQFIQDLRKNLPTIKPTQTAEGSPS